MRALLAALIWVYGASAEAAPDDPPPPAAPDEVVPDTASPLAITIAGPGQTAAADRTAVALRGAWVPDSGGATLYFVELTGDVVFIRGDSLHALRVAAPWGHSRVDAEDRAASVIGNVRLEYWNTDQPKRFRADRTTPWRNAWSLGVGVPVDDGDGVRFYEQRAEVHVPGWSFWGAWNAHISGTGYTLGVLATLGLTEQEGAFFGIVPMGILDVTLAVPVVESLAGTLSFVLPAEFARPNPTVLLGARWLPVDAFEVAAGTHIVLQAITSEIEDLSLFRPALEVRGRF